MTRKKAEYVYPEDLRERYRVPENFNPRFWIFALATKAVKWESNVDYMIWMSQQSANWKNERPGEQADDLSKLTQFKVAENFDRYLAEQVGELTEADFARARRYLATLGQND